MFTNVIDFLKEKIYFNFFIGGRGVGKTYSVLDHLKKCRKLFMYLRTSAKELEIAATSNVFGVVDKRITWRKLEDDFYAIEKNKKIIGYGCALSTFKNIRGVNFENVEIIFHDEFIPEVSARRIIKNEADAFFNLIESVNRNRELLGHDPITYIGCANANNIYNPYFISLKIITQVELAMYEGTNKYIDYERGLQVIILQASNEYINKKKQTALYKLTSGTDFEDMALNNKFSYNDFAQVKKNVKVAGYYPIIKIDDLIIWRKKGEKKYICRYGNMQIKGNTYNSKNDLENRLFFQTYHDALYSAILNDRIIFDSYEIKRKIFDILKIKC